MEQGYLRITAMQAGINCSARRTDKTFRKKIGQTQVWLPGNGREKKILKRCPPDNHTPSVRQPRTGQKYVELRIRIAQKACPKVYSVSYISEVQRQRREALQETL
jgi:hypothetical protein